jgi:predicted amidohydrolase YtcJ
MPDTNSPFRGSITRVIVNARIATGELRRPWVDAAALAGERIVRLGSSAEIRKLAPDGATVVDALGAQLSLDDLRRYA